MKNRILFSFLTVLITLGFSLPAMAVSKNSSWADIIKQGDFFVDFPVVQFLGGTVQVSIKDVCLDGNHIRKINSRYEKCFDQNDELVIQGPCARREVYTLSAPRVQVKDICMEYNYQESLCAKTKTVRSVIPVEQEVSVYRRNHEDLRAELIFKKSHKVSECP